MTHDLWATLNFKMYEYLSSVTLSDLVNRQVNKQAGMMPLRDERRLGPRPRARVTAVIA